MSFRVGQRVVCVDDDFDVTYLDGTFVALPRLRSVYQVRGVRAWSFLDGRATGLYLEEIANPILEWHGVPNPSEHPYAGRRFRPVKETDISIFTAMLAPTPMQKVRA